MVAKTVLLLCALAQAGVKPSPLPAGAAVKPAATTRARPDAGVAPAGTSKKKRREPRNPPVELYQVNFRETLQLRLFDEKGRRVKGVAKRFQRFARCVYTKKEHRIDPRLIDLVYKVGRHYAGKRIEVVSIYRHPTVARNPRSPHMQGLACDFRVPGVKNADLRDYLRKSFEKIGVGYYPNSSFVHLDVRKDRSAFWIDYSGPGERSMYSADPFADVKNGKADTFRPVKVPPSWTNGTPPADPFGDDSEPPPGAGATAGADGAAGPAEAQEEKTAGK